MQIDILSANTLKLTLNRLDMLDLDIKYESISGKNPETKRLLTHVLKSIRLDRKIGFDFSGERLFVEAFPRPDGGCMLYISCLSSIETENAPVKRGKKPKTTISFTDGKNTGLFKNDKHNNLENVDNLLKSSNLQSIIDSDTESNELSENLSDNSEKNGNKVTDFPKLFSAVQICEVEGLKALAGLCRNLCWQAECERLSFDSSLYAKGSIYRLAVNGDSPRLIAGIIKEFGELLRSELDKASTEEHFKLIVKENAAELMNKCL